MEARAFQQFLNDGSLISKASIGCCNAEEYLGGVADLLGEMQRYAVLKATHRKVEDVRRCRALAADVQEAFMELNLRNGNLRKKSDSIKYALKRFEDILYQLSLIPEGRKIDADVLDEAAEEGPPKRLKQDDNDE